MPAKKIAPRNHLALKKRGSTYYIQGTVDGRRIRRSAGTDSRDYAEAELERLRKELLDAHYFDQILTFGRAIEHYLEKGGEARFLMPLYEELGDRPVREITPQVVSEFSRRKFGHLQPATIARHLYVPLNAVINTCAREGLCAPANFRAPRVHAKPVIFPQDDWFARFLEHAHDRIGTAVTFLTMTGARCQEVCDLEVQNCDLDRGYATIWMGKTRRSRRIKLHPYAVAAVAKAISLHDKIEPSTQVFGYANRWSVNTAIRRVCEKAQIPYFSSHKVGRHAWAARMLREGSSLQAVRDAGGWATVQVLSKRYGHLEHQLVDSEVVRAGNRLEQSLQPNYDVCEPSRSSGTDLAQRGNS